MEDKHTSQTAVSARKTARTSFLPFARPHITQAEIDEVVDTLRSGWLSTGPKRNALKASLPTLLLLLTLSLLTRLQQQCTWRSMPLGYARGMK